MGELVHACVSREKYTLIYCWNLLGFQMVGVSDDVNEYAMALKDTEEKISRCPKRVSVYGLPVYFSGRRSVSGKKGEARWVISSPEAARVLDGVVTHAWSWQLHFIPCQPIVPLSQGTEGLKQLLWFLLDKPWQLANLHMLQTPRSQCSGVGTHQCWTGDISVLFQLPETECV